MIYAHRFPSLSSRVLPLVRFNCVYRSLANTLIFRLKHINMIIESCKKRLVDVELKIYLLKSEFRIPYVRDHLFLINFKLKELHICINNTDCVSTSWIPRERCRSYFQSSCPLHLHSFITKVNYVEQKQP